MRGPRNLLRPQHQHETRHHDIVIGRRSRFTRSQSSDQRIKHDQEDRSSDYQWSTPRMVCQEDRLECSNRAYQLDDRGVGKGFRTETDLRKEAEIR